APLSAQYGSWGMVEYINQDTSLIPAPKYRALLNSIHSGCFVSCPQNCTTPTGWNTTHITSTSAKVHWQSVTCAIKYNIRYRPVGSGSWKNTSAKQSKTSKKLKNLLPGTQYEWQIRSRCSDSPLITSDYSPSQFFTTTPARPEGIEQPCVVAVYPNPVSNQLFIGGCGDVAAQYAILNLQGQRVQTGLLDSWIDVSSLPAGMYFVRLSCLGNIYMLSFIKN
ncbi:MAG: T9SS type A sorting domain-containing protein, partial [Chitinophagales bacterium]|nr:T9SS type A sorting domain-containing protein [Chitinophagales bacterium]MDW8427432.1 T9SS type A sorting domain-containing protein [Chitinophagales bacterium]